MVTRRYPKRCEESSRRCLEACEPRAMSDDDLKLSLGDTRRALKGVARSVLGPSAWRWLKTVTGRGPRRLPWSVLDATLDEAARAFAASEEAGRAYLSTVEFEVPIIDGDPFSPAFRDAQLRLYERIAGRAYRAKESETSRLSAAEVTRRPYPFSTGSSRVVGDYFTLLGFVLSTLDLEPGATVIELGPGWGHTTRALLQVGCDVTAVEVDDGFAAALEGSGAKVVRADMLEFTPSAPVDVVLFFESFHHASDPVALLSRLVSWLAPGGLVCFAAEPIDSAFSMPWGVRLDGLSAWSIRRHGWLELGFRPDFFFELLDRAGLTGLRVRSPAHPDAQAIIARRK
jgi:SAM-dependent methyltransferase